MATIEQLMQYGTKRKVEGIAIEMGYSKGAVEYPDEVLEEVKKRCSKKRSVSENVQSAAEQETENVAKQDLKSVEQAAESRAAGILTAFDSLTMMHCATRKFSDPNLQQAVDESQSRLRQMLSSVASLYEPESFLAQTPLVQIAAGESGSMRSLPGSKSLPSESEPETKPEKERKPSASR